VPAKASLFNIAKFQTPSTPIFKTDGFPLKHGSEKGQSRW
jgi:hypothetical protein